MFCFVVWLKEDMRAGGGFRENSNSESSILDDRTFSSGMSIRPVEHPSSTYTGWLDHWGHPHSYTCQTFRERNRQTDRDRQTDRQTVRQQERKFVECFCYSVSLMFENTNHQIHRILF